MPADPLGGTARLGDAVWTVLLALLLTAPATLHAQARPDLAGIWSTTMTTPDDEAWNLEDYGCFLGCMLTAYERLRALLNDPANDERPYEELMVEAWRHGAGEFVAALTPAGLARRDEIGFGDDDAIACRPPGFVRQVLSPLPLEITQHDDRVVPRYEEWNGAKTIRMLALTLPDGRELAAEDVDFQAIDRRRRR